MFKKTCLSVIAFILCSAPSFAAMPLVTDDTGTQGKGRWQIELGVERTQETEIDSGVTTKEISWSPSATFTYGLTDNIDLITGIPWACQKLVVDGTTLSDEYGIGDISLQLKWRLMESPDGKTAIAIRPGMTIPSGNENKGCGNGRMSGGAMLIATHVAEQGAVHFNLGYTRNEYRLESDRSGLNKDIWHASLAGELKLARKLYAVADIGMDTNQEKEKKLVPVYVLGGLIFSPTEKLDLDFGVRGGLNDAEPATSILAGITLRY